MLGYNILTDIWNRKIGNSSRGFPHMDQKKRSRTGFTRRQILKGVPLATVGAFALGVVSGGVFSAFFRGRKRMPNFPEDSIFAPDRNRYPNA